MNPELDRKLRYLRLSGMAAALPARNQEAIHHHLAYPEFLELLVEDELATRRDRLFARRLKQAGIMEVKSLDAYDYVQCPVMCSKCRFRAGSPHPVRHFLTFGTSLCT